ncbi:MAG TPA: aspartate aminotransferase family protein [Acidothermaceae bacterium]|nr:aspartate aminotransferase family protein [Acidothermaceae bacterium]
MSSESDGHAARRDFGAAPVEARWARSAQAWERAKAVLGGGVSTGLRASMRPHPLFFERGEGSRIWDVDGHSYLDYVLGWGPLILGHSHPSLVAAVGRQLRLGQTFGAGHRAEYEVAEQLCAAIPGAEKVLWSNTGSEANQIALRLARAATGRVRFIKFWGHYHGWSDSMLFGYRPSADGSLEGLASKGQHPGGLDDVILVPWNDLDAVRAALAAGSDSIAAIFAEPVLCNSGVIAPAPGFLDGLRKLCDSYGALLVFDEVITGFRVAYGGGSERYGVPADLVVLAKAIGAGLPLAAVAGRADLIDLTTKGVVHAGTHNGGPLVLAAASVTLTELARPGIYSTFEQRAARLVSGIRDSFERHGVLGAAHHVGPVVQVAPGIASVGSFSDYLCADWDWYDALTIQLLQRGVFNLPGGRWYISTAHTAEQIDETVEAFDDAVEATTNGVGLPQASPLRGARF